MMPSGLRSMLARLARAVTWMENTLLGFILSAMVLLAAAQILLRNLMHKSVEGADDLVRLLVLWVALLGAVAASREGKHIHVDAVVRWLPARARSWAGALTDLFTLSVCGALAWESVRYMIQAHASGDKAIGSLPVWVTSSILPLAFTLIGLRYGLRLVRHLRQALGLEVAE